MEIASALLQANDLSCARDNGDFIFSKLNLEVRERDVVILQGRSGSGKTTLLKALAHLTVYEGQVLYRGRPPNAYGIPSYRTKVLYVPQRPSLLPGTPRDFLAAVTSFSSRMSESSSSKAASDPFEMSRAWGVDPPLWDRPWNSLSGGEAQRITLAIAVGLDSAEVLLLDEPTSALDPMSSLLVEKTLISELNSSESAVKALVWITHSEEQGHRVGRRFIQIGNGGAQEVLI